MKTITQDYKEAIKEFGKQLDSKITYELDGETVELGAEELNSITPTFQGGILKSVMRELDIDSNEDIPLNTVITYQFGVKVDSEYEYINYGNFVVYKSEKQEDTRSYKLTCYDKMLYAMKDYEEVVGTYPMTVRDYITELCDTIGLTFKNASDTFANYDKLIPSDLYKGIGYTYRDVLDELAQVTASTICINEQDDELEIRYVNEGNVYSEVTGSALSLNPSYKGELGITPIGASTQESTSGKQLLEPTVKRTWKGITLETKKDGLHVSGTVDISSSAGSLQSMALGYYTKVLPAGTYTFSGFASWQNNNEGFVILYDKNSNVIQNRTYQTTTFTVSEDLDAGWFIAIFLLQGSTYDFVFPIMLQSGSTATDYEPYTNGAAPNPDYPYPIKDVTGDNEVEIVNRNLFNIDDVVVASGQMSKTVTNNVLNLKATGTGGAQFCVNYIRNVDSSKTYNFSFKAKKVVKGTDGNPYISIVVSGSNDGTNYTFVRSFLNANPTQGTEYSFSNTVTGYSTYRFNIYNNANTPVTVGEETEYYEMQFKEGSSATPYQEHKSQSHLLSLGDIHLRGIGDYKDSIVGSHDNWQIKREIGDVVLDGSEDYAVQTQTGYYRYGLTNVPNIANSGSLSNLIIIKSNYFRGIKFNDRNTDTNETVYSVTNNTQSQIWFNTNVAETKADFKTWLSTHNTEIQYVLSNPTYETITDETLINQLNELYYAYSYEGQTNVFTNGNLQMPLNVKYISSKNIDTIDEESLKDVNVEFGEKYGPVNSIVLSRSAESDNVYLRDEESIEENGLCEIKIKDNQIMNFNDRSDYLPDILRKLNGLEYYINDFTSTGVTYLELCDRYNVEVFGKIYSCILFNDETKVTQGLEEVIYTDMPEGTVTDYSKADKTDRRINQVYIIADKQAGKIQSLVTQNIENENQIRELQTQMTQTSESLQVSVLELTEQLNQTSQDLSESIDNINSTLNDGVDTLKNTLVTIDINGISVSTNTSAISTLMTNDKFAIQTSSGQTLAYFGYDYDLGKTVSRMDNLEITTYLTAGYHRQEKMDNGRTGWFYNGGA